MSSVRPSTARVPHGVPRQRLIPVNTIYCLLFAGAVGAAAHQFPEVATPVSLGLATFLTLDRLARQIR